ncbi:hypothetical protein EXIGLDRAFT_723756 [Exidia glandulosa HHB12029]|uniref:Uncharacterized protein n=1 Tax=Exidia glandulosa HHB12029 TaxID=1314781 RepID=A0A165EP26_EXIGL|nr:hypothetical protein EXIGLDRAFT_723756 [Exidia glandulosa HHB12029]
MQRSQTTIGARISDAAELKACVSRHQTTRDSCPTQPTQPDNVLRDDKPQERPGADIFCVGARRYGA